MLSSDSYTPLQSGAGANASSGVYYNEQIAHGSLAAVVQCYWTLKTVYPLEEKFSYTVMPDACIDIVVDATGATDPIVMTPSVAIETLQLGRAFHYVGIRFKPGVLKGGVDLGSIIGNQKSISSIFGEHIDVSEFSLRPAELEQIHYETLERLVYEFVDARLVEQNTFIEDVLLGMQQGLSIGEIAAKTGYSSRQLQRKVTAQTGFSPVQLRRIVRFQSVLSSGEYRLKFSDQSHLIKEFKAVTGVSYANFAGKYIDVRKIQS